MMPITRAGVPHIRDNRSGIRPLAAAPRAPKRSSKSEPPLPRIGWREWVHLPELGGAVIKAKVDTGARTSALHAWNIETLTRNGERFIRFDLHPLQQNDLHVMPCEAPLLDQRLIRNSGGQTELRHIIHTLAQLGPYVWRIELSLTSRDEMGFRMLLGRSAVRGKFLVDPGRSFVLGQHF